MISRRLAVCWVRPVPSVLLVVLDCVSYGCRAVRMMGLPAIPSSAVRGSFNPFNVCRMHSMWPRNQMFVPETDQSMCDMQPEELGCALQRALGGPIVEIVECLPGGPSWTLVWCVNAWPDPTHTDKSSRNSAKWFSQGHKTAAWHDPSNSYGRGRKECGRWGNVCLCHNRTMYPMLLFGRCVRLVEARRVAVVSTEVLRTRTGSSALRC